MARHQVTKDQDRRNCLGCLLFLALLAALLVFLFWLGAGAPS